MNLVEFVLLMFTDHTAEPDFGYLTPAKVTKTIDPEFNVFIVEFSAISKDLAIISIERNSQTKSDFFLQTRAEFHKKKEMIAFDLDSTLIKEEGLDLYAKFAGKESEVALITEQAMKGLMDFKESFRERVQILKDSVMSHWEAVLKNIHLSDGAYELCQFLDEKKIIKVILSGGIYQVASFIGDALNIDTIHCNRLSSIDGKLDGKIVGSIVGKKEKADFLKQIAIQRNISLDAVVAIGDGANDLDMLNMAGTGIAYKAKPKVRQQAKYRLEHFSLRALKYLFTEF